MDYSYRFQNFISKALKSCKNLEDEDDRVKVKADIRDIFKTFCEYTLNKRVLSGGGFS